MSLAPLGPLTEDSFKIWKWLRLKGSPMNIWKVEKTNIHQLNSFGVSIICQTLC